MDMKAGKVPEKNEARDKEMVADHLLFKKIGKPFTAKMVGKYHISMTRIYDVLKSNGVKIISPRKK